MLASLSIHLTPMLPRTAILLLGVALVLLLAHGCWVLRRKLVPGRWVTMLAVLRVLIIGLFLWCLFQPVLSYTRTEERRPELLVLVDTSRSMAGPAITGAGTRLDVARAALRGGLLDKLGQQYQLRLYTFDRTANPVEARDLPGLQADGGATSLGASLGAALEYARQLSEEVSPVPARILVVSDGADNGSVDPTEVARRHAVTVDVLPVESGGAATTTVAAVVADMQAPRRVLLGSECELQVTLRREEIPPGQVDLHVFAGDAPVATRPVAFAAGQTEARVQLTHRPAKPGLESYAFVVSPSGRTIDRPPAGAIRLSVQVVDTRHEVLILEDGWRWEFRFLRRVLEDDPSFNFTAMLPRGPGFVQFAEPSRRAQLAGFPQHAADLDPFDLLVLGNANPRRWPRGLAEGIAHAVMEEGKSLIVLAGPNLRHLAQVPALLPLLPVELAEEAGRPLEGPVEVRPSREGAGSPFLANVFAAGGGFRALPPLDSIYRVVRKRPGATILLEANRLANSYGNLIVMAEHTVGRGRVLFIGTDTIWKWQMLPEPNLHGLSPATLFWQQALRAMMPPQPPSAGAMVWLQPERTQVDAGHRVVVRAETRTDSGVRGQLQAVVQTPEGRELPLPFAPDAVQAGLYRSEFVAALAGEYVVRAALVVDGKREAEASAAVSSRALPPERPDSPGNAPALERLAAVTGGNVLSPDDPQTWPVGPAKTGVEVTRTHALDLWNRFILPV
ncbi:VWA domain-containing protein, partial [bacterium]|nr:VWA domain-containing protein [bacterium]